MTPIDTIRHHGPHLLAKYPLNGNLLDVKCRPTVHIFMTPTTIHVQPGTCRSMRSCLATIDAKYHESICSVCIHCFRNIPKLLNLFYFCCLYSTGISPLYFQTFPPWPLPRPLSSRLVRKVVPERKPVRLLRLLLLILLSLLLQEDVLPERQLVPDRTSVRTTIRSIQAVRSTLMLLLLLSLIRPTCLPIVRRPEP